MKTNVRHNVTVDQPIEKVWAIMSDPWKVAPCLPGAEITEAIGNNEFNGRVKLKLGPLSLSVKGRIAIEELDAGAYSIRMRGKGNDLSGAGNASVTLQGQLTRLGDSDTAIATDAEVEINGRMAQFAGRLIQGVSETMFNKFLANLKQTLSEMP